MVQVSFDHQQVANPNTLLKISDSTIVEQGAAVANIFGFEIRTNKKYSRQMHKWSPDYRASNSNWKWNTFPSSIPFTHPKNNVDFKSIGGKKNIIAAFVDQQSMRFPGIHIPIDYIVMIQRN